METKLNRIAELSSINANEVFTSIYHLLNKELLMQCHQEQDKNKAKGIDGISKEDYEQNLDENLDNLVLRLKNKSYKPSPTLRKYIPKGNGKQRPLGIASYEDKIVQKALKKLIEAIYEPRFLDCMYGFRPNRGCHDALKSLNWIIESKKINYVLDADIKGFFENIDHEWLMKCLETKIKDKNILGLVKKYLKAGLMEDNVYSATEVGTAQGSNLSPVLANIYMHYVLTLWFYKEVRKEMKGESYLIVYADDFVCCFQYKKEAEEFYRMLQERLRRFGLELEMSKSRLINFGRFANEDNKPDKPETFDFLGFTHYCGVSKNGKFRVKRKTSKKKYGEKVKKFEQWMKENRIQPLKTIIPKVNKKLVGHYNYYGITDNSPMIAKYYQKVIQIMFKWLNRRSQKASYTWEGFNEMLKYYPLVRASIRVNIYEK